MGGVAAAVAVHCAVRAGVSAPPAAHRLAARVAAESAVAADPRVRQTAWDFSSFFKLSFCFPAP